MKLIDEEGRLVGTVNIIDAAVVVLVLTVAVAGIAVIGLGGEEEPATRFATVELGPQPTFVAEQIAVGDRVGASGVAGNVTVTDVYVTRGGGQANVTVRLEIDGRLVDVAGEPDPAFAFGAGPLRRGRTLTLETDRYRVEGTVSNVDTGGEALETAVLPVVLETRLPASVANDIEAGDTFELAGRSIGTVEVVRVLLSGEDAREVAIGVRLSTIEVSNAPAFAGRSLVIGETVPFRTATYSLEGRVSRIGTTEVPVGREQVIIETRVQTTTADLISVGDSFGTGGERAATVESLRTYPTDDPTQRRLVLGLSVVTLEREGVSTFRGSPIRAGEPFTFVTDSYQLTGTVVQRGSLSLPGERTTHTVVLELANVEPAVADSVSVGMTETIRGERFATVVEKRTEPASVVLESESGEIFEREHPRNRDVYLTVEVRTRTTADGIRFHGRPLLEDRTVVLDLGRIIVAGEVIEIRD